MDMPYGPWSSWVDVRCVTISPHDPAIVYAGSHIGLHRSVDGGRKFDFVTTPFDSRQIWSIAVHPHDPQNMLAGIAPFDSNYPLWRTLDGGETWAPAGLEIPPRREVIGAIHVTSIAFDPRDSSVVYCSIEIGGVFKSIDCGATWSKIGPLGATFLDEDIHWVTMTPKGTLFATSPMGLYRSDDEGRTFEMTKFGGFPATDPVPVSFGVTGYSRGIAFNRDRPDTIYVGIGDSTPGLYGAIMISRDDGKNWERAKLPVEPNSNIYHVVTHPTNPDRVLAATMNGYVYLSDDSGQSWRKLSREFGEIRGLGWVEG